MLPGLTDGLPVPICPVVPQLSANQYAVQPPPTVADRVEEPPVQIVLGVAVGLVGVVGAEFTVTATLAQDELQHPVELFFVLA